MVVVHEGEAAKEAAAHRQPVPQGRAEVLPILRGELDDAVVHNVLEDGGGGRAGERIGCVCMTLQRVKQWRWWVRGAVVGHWSYRFGAQQPRYCMTSVMHHPSFTTPQKLCHCSLVSTTGRCCCGGRFPSVAAALLATTAASLAVVSRSATPACGNQSRSQ